MERSVTHDRDLLQSLNRTIRSLQGEVVIMGIRGDACVSVKFSAAIKRAASAEEVT